MKASGSYAAIAALTAVANARHVLRSEPEPTHNFKLPDDGVSPRPTEAAMELFRRADKAKTLWAPDNTCGYISGRQGAAYTCNGDYSCAFVETDSSSGNVACCSAGTCNVRYSCVDYVDYWSSSACDDGCQFDVNTLKCTATTAQYCNTISFAGGVTDYWCNDLNLSAAQAATTVYSGGDERKYTTQAVSTTAESSTESTSSSSAHRSTVTVSGSGASSAASSSSSADNGDDNNHKKSSNTGPIVGGVVGGIAFIALVGAGIWFFLRNKKKKDAAAAAAATTTTPPAYQPPPMQQQPGIGPGGYNPVPQGQTGYYDPKNPYPSPGAQYNTVAGFYQPGTPDPNHDPRLSAVNTSPTPTYNQQGVVGQQQPGFQTQQPVIHEAPADNHGRNETHELA